MENNIPANPYLKYGMAQLNQNNENPIQGKTAGVKKIKKHLIKVDMTPMVDLGFLLITFFIYTTTMGNPTVMKLIMPVNEPDVIPINIKNSGAMTILIGKDNRLYYYMGKLEKNASNFLAADFNMIRKIILNKKKEVMQNHIHEKTCNNINKDNKGTTACLDRDLFIMIKPNENANYKSIVDILDEMTINQIKRYALIDIEKSENELLNKSRS